MSESTNNIDGDGCRIVRSNKGGPKLIHRGYIYTVHKQRRGVVRWRCTRRSLFCKGSMTTTSISEDTVANVLSAHNHPPDQHAVAMTIGMDKKHRNDDDRQQADSIILSGPHPDSQEGTAVKIQPSPSKKKQATAGHSRQEEPQEFIKQEVSLKPQKVSKRIMEKRKLQDHVIDREFPTRERRLRDDEEVCLRWNSHHNNMQTAFPFLLAREQYVDVTLCSEGQSIRCHKLVLSSCSSYFDEIISSLSPWQHPVIYLKGIPFWVLKSLIDFMYVGEVSIQQSKLQIIMDAGEELKIKGLSRIITPQQLTPFKSAEASNGQQKAHPLPPPAAPPVSFHSERSLLKPRVATHNNKPKTPTENKSMPMAAEQKVDEMKSFKTKRPQKRRLSETSTTPELPEHLLFMRKGTRSRPLVKTPKIYQNDCSSSYTKSEADVKPREVKEHREAPISINEYDDEKRSHSILKFSSPEQGITQIKQEPIDIGDTDVTFGDDDGLFFDEPDNDDGAQAPIDDEPI